MLPQKSNITDIIKFWIESKDSRDNVASLLPTKSYITKGKFSPESDEIARKIRKLRTLEWN